MTVICFDGETLAVDGRATIYHSTLANDRVNKLHKVYNPYFEEEVIMACCGSLGTIGPWLDAVPEIGFGELPLKSLDEDKDRSAGALTVTKGGECFYSNTSGEYYQVEGPIAIGSGADIARHFLVAKSADAVTAIKEAIKTELSCGGTIRTYNYKTDTIEILEE